MSDLQRARSMMNAKVRESLESRDIADPSDFDDTVDVSPALAVGMLVDDALSLDDGRMTTGGGRARPWLPWEIIL